MIGVHISLYQHIRARLAGGIRAVRIVGGSLIEKCRIILRQAAVHFICRYMQEFLAFLETAVRQFPCGFRTVQHDCCAQYIGLHKHFRIFDTSVHMALCRKMHHSVNVIFRKDLADRILVTDICLDKRIVVTVLDILQILQIPRIGECIHIDDADLIPILFEHVMNVV